MVFENVVDDGKPQTRAVLLGGEEGIEDAREVCFGDAGAGVFNGHGEVAVLSGRRDGQRPFFTLHRVQAVEEEIQKGLAELLGVGFDWLLIVGGALHLHAPLEAFAAEEVQGLLEEL